MSSNPEKLLQQARTFDQEALARIYDLYSDALYAYAYKHVGTAQVAEDLMAETFRRFLTALEHGGGPQDHLRAYLYRITHNLITDLYRREPPPAQELDEDRLVEDSPGPSTEIAQTMGKSLGSVKALQHRGVAALQRILLEGEDPSPG